MIAKKEEVLRHAASAVYQMTEDERIRERCRMREEYWNHERAKKEIVSKLENQLKEKDDQLKEKDDQLKEKDDQLKEKDEEIFRLRQLLAEKKQNM